MTRFKSTLCAAVALSFAASSAIPVAAAPLFVPKAQSAVDNVIDVQMRDQNRFDRRQPRRDGRFERRGNIGYYNGHRGYHERRPGYRYHNGYWFPAAAFIAGAIISGAIANDRPARSGSAHVEWCYDRYRSYREWDNTFQPYNGPRQQCRSPYG